MDENRFKLARTKHNQHGKQSVKTVSEKTGITRSLIDDLESSIKPRQVSYMRVAQLADYYGVSMEYLSGISPVPTSDLDVMAICKYTGLNSSAIETLHRISNSDDTRDRNPLLAIEKLLDGLNGLHTLQLINIYLSGSNLTFSVDGEEIDSIDVLIDEMPTLEMRANGEFMDSLFMEAIKANLIYIKSKTILA